MPKILSVAWPEPRPFWGKLLIGIPYAKLRTKFEVSILSSWNSFEDILDRLPENLGVTPLLGRIICARARLSEDEVMYHIW